MDDETWALVLVVVGCGAVIALGAFTILVLATIGLAEAIYGPITAL